MANNNKVILIGNIGGEAKTHKDKKGKLFTAFSIATRDSFKDEKGVWQEKETEWHSVLSFNPKIVQLMESFKKGARLEVQGSLSYKDVPQKQGKKEFNLRDASIIAWSVFPAPLPKKALPAPSAEQS